MYDVLLYVALVFLRLTICLDGEQQWLNGIIVFMIELGKIEGASQRVQEDTIKFSRIMEALGTSLIEAVMILLNLCQSYLV